MDYPSTVPKVVLPMHLVRKALVGATVTALAITTLPATAGPPGSTGQPTLPVQVDSAKVVTLLTGDKVQVTPAGSGRSSVRFVPADSAHAGYETRTVGKDLYVVPDSAARLVNRGKVDQALFNVSGLIRQGYDDASTSQIPVIATYKPTARAAQQAVPAGETVDVPVTIDPSAPLDPGAYGAVSARVVATGNDGRTVVTPLGFYLEPQYVDVTFKLIDRDGKPAASITSLDVFDLDSIAAQRVGFDGADQTLHLRAGTYSLAATIAHDDANGLVDSYAFLGDPEITLTKDTTITYDARTAAEAKVTTQRPTERKGGSLTYGRIVDNWVLASSRGYGTQVKSIYLGTTPKARRGTFEVVEGWQYGSPAGAKSPYLYSLAFTHEQQVKGKPDHRVRDRDLATIDATYYTPGNAYNYSEYVDVWRPWSINLIPTGDRGTVAAPTRVQHLVTADRDTKVSQMVGHADAMAWPFATLMTSTATAYEAGSRHSESWFKAGLRQGLVTDQTTGLKYAPAARDGNTVWSSFASWSDTEPGHFSRQGFLDLGGTELLADGVSLGEYGYYGQGVWDVPAAATNLELVYDLMRWQRGDYKWESPSTVETRWKWKSSAADAGKPLPLLFPDYDLAVDLNDRAPRIPVFPVSITAESGQWYEPGRFTSARVWTSYDDGTTWSQTPVVNLGTKAVALVNNSKATTFVTLKVELTDSNGKSVTQTLTRFYGIR
jgi:hypothetical protein